MTRHALAAVLYALALPAAAQVTPAANYTDMWWNPNESGWGISIAQHTATNKVFAVWYTYDQAGRTVWYVVPGGAWSAANVFSGTAYRTQGSPWVGAAYNPNALVATPAGSVTFRFDDANHATLSYTVDGVTGSKPISRQPF